MDEDRVIAIYESAYTYELQRRDRLNARLSLPIAVIPILLGAISVLLSDLHQLPPWMSLVCLGVHGMATVGIGYALYAITRAFSIHRYRHVANLGSLDAYLHNIEEYNEEASDDQIDIEGELTRLLREQYRDCTVINIERNGLKNGYFIRALRALAAAALMIAVAAAPHYVTKMDDADRIAEVRITNFEEFILMPDEKPQPTRPSPPPTEDRSDADVKPQAPIQSKGEDAND